MMAKEFNLAAYVSVVNPEASVLGGPFFLRKHLGLQFNYQIALILNSNSAPFQAKLHNLTVEPKSQFGYQGS